MRSFVLLSMIVTLFSTTKPAYAYKATPEQFDCAISLHERAWKNLRDWTWEKQVEASGKDPKKLSPDVIREAEWAHRVARKAYEGSVKHVTEAMKLFKDVGTDLKRLADLSIGATLVKEGIISVKERDDFIKKCGDWLFAGAECMTPEKPGKKEEPSAASKEKVMYNCTEKNVSGSYPKGGGCNVSGCYPPGGGCNVNGCYPAGGSCNVNGCTSEGHCTVKGCPSPISKDSYKCQ